jgi:hypothetical protein
MIQQGSSKHRPLFHAVILAIGFVVGGLFQNAAREWLPSGAVKSFFTNGVVVTPSLGPVSIDLIILNLQLGPLAMDVSVISVLGVLLAFLIAKSLF